MITATQVKDLREKTGVGMMECKKALEENQGDMEKAIVWLRERGMSRAAKKADRIAAEGIVEVFISEDQNSGVLLEVNCETDFVSKNEEFQAMVRDAAALALKNRATTVEALEGLKLATGKTIKERVTELIAKIGENMQLRRVTVLTSSNGTVAGYSHMGGRIGTLVVLDGKKGEDVANLGKDLAMHVAAASPRYMTSADVNTAELATEREIARKKLIEEKKPEAMIEKILDGQMKKFFKEVCLIEQAFVKDPDTQISKLVEKSGGGAKLTAFGRFALGEGIEKKKEDFAAEVAATLKK
jgi:elongation factor Ts